VEIFMRLLLLSNATNFGCGYLDHAMPMIREHLGTIRTLLFVPFAIHDHEVYTDRVRERFGREGIEVAGLTQDAAGTRAMERAEAVFVGGGNTFRLLDGLQRANLLEPLRGRARSGMPYLGSSAGSVIAAPTLKTTNDMPIVQPRSFEALGLVPFQINAHYFDADPASRHMGETRETRLREFHEENDTPVVGLREGAWLHVEDGSVRLGGETGAKIFRRGEPPEDASPGDVLSRLV
jgi:dipeptidase E